MRPSYLNMGIPILVRHLYIETAAWFNVKISLLCKVIPTVQMRSCVLRQYKMIFPCIRHKTVTILFYLYNGNSYTGDIESLCWDGWLPDLEPKILMQINHDLYIETTRSNFSEFTQIQCPQKTRTLWPDSIFLTHWYQLDHWNKFQWYLNKNRKTSL